MMKHDITTLVQPAATVPVLSSSVAAPQGVCSGGGGNGCGGCSGWGGATTTTYFINAPFVVIAATVIPVATLLIGIPRADFSTTVETLTLKSSGLGIATATIGRAHPIVSVT